MRVKVQNEWFDFDNEDELSEQLEKFDAPITFQSFEDFPSCLFGERKLDERLWDYARLDEREQDIVATYLEEEDSSAEVKYILDIYKGTYDDQEDYARQYIDEMGVFAGHPDLEQFFDFDAYADDLRHNGTLFLESITENHTYVFCY